MRFQDDHVSKVICAAPARLVSETTLELLRTISRQRPRSMRGTATLVERDFKDVPRNLYELAGFGVIEFEEDGWAKRPVIRFDKLVIDIPVTAM
ncbi:MAG TPA: hypothetical protein VFJ06_11280 [Halococcus sp.]|nr:hypothetical protein [Halococcus sp.]